MRDLKTKGEREEEGEEEKEEKEGFQGTSLEPRQLSAAEAEKLASERVTLSDFHRAKLERDAQRNWDVFYKRNEARFFRDRHWTGREFSAFLPSERALTLLEVGCGAGNFLFPLLASHPRLRVLACDFSPRAVALVQKDPRFEATRCEAFVCDVASPGSLAGREGCADVASLVFVLSAVHPDKMGAALAQVARTLVPGGHLLVRDYGLHDHAQLRFGRGAKLGERFYARQDGTRSFFFELEEMRALLAGAGLEVLSCQFVLRRTVNLKEEVSVPRVFVQAVARKLCSVDSPRPDDEKAPR